MMKTKLSILLLSLVVCLCAFSTLAQGKEEKAQLYFVEEVIIPPASFQAYEDFTTKEFNAVLAKYKWHTPIRVYMDFSYRYYFVFAVKDFAEVENIFKVWNEILQKWGAQNADAFMKRFGDLSKYYKYYFMRHAPKLSYVPQNPRLKEGEMPFMSWDFWYPIPGREAELDGMIKKTKEMLTSNDMPDGFNVFRGDIGTNMPVYMTAWYGKDIPDLFVNASKAWEKLGPKFFELFYDSMSFLRKREIRLVWYRPDLSYMPKE
jgi:hypothetical protein